LKYKFSAAELPSPDILPNPPSIQGWMLVPSSTSAMVLNASNWDMSFASGWMAIPEKNK